MKMHVITNELGEVIATAPAGKHKNVSIQIEPVHPKHTLHEAIDVPDDLGNIEDADQFHAHVRKHLPKRKA